MNILAVCRGGLVRSVCMTDVLKLHFEPVDAIALGWDFAGYGTKKMLLEWADLVIPMDQHFNKQVNKFLDAHLNKNLMANDLCTNVQMCDVGADTYHTPKSPELIDKCWNWARDNCRILGIEEHSKVL